MPRSESGSPSPAWKRQRLSSPTYDEQCMLSQDELKAFDVFDSTTETGGSSFPARGSYRNLSESHKRTHDAAFALDDERDSNNSTGLIYPKDNYKCQTASAEPSAAGETTSIRKDYTEVLDRYNQLSSSLDCPSEKDDSGFFESTSMPPGGLNFQSALSLAALNNGDVSQDSMICDISTELEPRYGTSESSHIQSPLLGFTSALHAPNTFADPRSSTSTAFLGFTSGLQVISSTEPRHRDEEPASTSTPALMGFTSALSAASNTGEVVDDSVSFSNEIPVVTGFTSALGLAVKKPRSLVPSAEASAAAARRMEQWHRDIDSENIPLSGTSAVQDQIQSPAEPLQSTPARKMLSAMENSFSPGQLPESPTPAGGAFKKPAIPLYKPAIQLKNKPFKSPMRVTPLENPYGRPSSSSGYIGSRLNPNFAAEVASTPNAYILPTPIPAPSFVSPMKSLGVTPRQGTPLSLGKAKFVTPFKPGMRPGEPGRVQLQQQQVVKPEAIESIRVTTPSTSRQAQQTPLSAKAKGKSRPVFFDLAQPAGRQNLEHCGMRPRSYTVHDFGSMNINIADLNQITPTTALFYAFEEPPNPTDPISSCSNVTVLDRETAFKQLLEKGCSLATQRWVDNHWGLIVWKLAGMVALDPISENDLVTRRWCYAEVFKQLLYRYERELNSGKRPPLRLIATGDARASCPMTLCISNITWPPNAKPYAEDPANTDPSNLPVVELTDGWYKLRAEIDCTLARAIRKGVLRIGKKISLATAKLRREGKDAEDVLDAYESCRLRICGNSSNLAPWHAKLGWLAQPPISTLDSLTPDGGLVTALDLVVIKQHPIGYMEFFEEDGKSWMEGPRNQRDEDRLEDQWNSRREAQADKLRDAFHQRMHTYQGYIERLEHQAGSFVPTTDDSPPDYLEGMFEEIEEDSSQAGAVFRKLTKRDAGWMARYIRELREKQQDKIGEEIERELDATCPPRNVKNLRVLVVRDARWYKRHPCRRAQVTVWNVLNIQTHPDASPGHFKVGDRYLATNLTPSHKRAWMGVQEGAEIYLTTRNESTWRRLGSTTVE